jgi:hypothetical protein
VHEGRKLPARIVLGHFESIPMDIVGELVSSMRGGATEEKGVKLPPLLTLERLVSYSLVNYLEKQDRN